MENIEQIGKDHPLTSIVLHHGSSISNIMEVWENWVSRKWSRTLDPANSNSDFEFLVILAYGLTLAMASGG